MNVGSDRENPQDIASPAERHGRLRGCRQAWRADAGRAGAQHRPIGGQPACRQSRAPVVGRAVHAQGQPRRRHRGRQHAGRSDPRGSRHHQASGRGFDRARQRYIRGRLQPRFRAGMADAALRPHHLAGGRRPGAFADIHRLQGFRPARSGTVDPFRRSRAMARIRGRQTARRRMVPGLRTGVPGALPGARLGGPRGFPGGAAAAPGDAARRDRQLAVMDRNRAETRWSSVHQLHVDDP